MNKKIPFMLLAVSTILLTACESKLSQEKFVDKLNATKANVVITSDKLNNVHMQNRLGVHKLNYKEGEYFTDETAALAIIIPIIKSVTHLNYVVIFINFFNARFPIISSMDISNY